LADNFTISSSISEDVWHQQTSPKAYEWWYFDALSDDGKNAIVVIFLDNFIFSPRYNNKNSTVQCPAIAFTYYRNGKPLYRAYNEFLPANFDGNFDVPFCKIGESEMIFTEAPYGSGYSLNISVLLHKNRQLKANLEWLVIEGDFFKNKTDNSLESHNWNLVAPRCDVTGKIEVFRRNGKQKDNIQFRGSGYHDHNFDNRKLSKTVSKWTWGRVHLAGLTVVFYQYLELNSVEATIKIFITKNNELAQLDAYLEETEIKRNIFGLKYPKSLCFTTNSGYKLSVKQSKIIDASFFYLRFYSEFMLTTPDGNIYVMHGISEQLSPQSLENRWLDWLVDMRIGKNGKGAFLP
jgi:carotenoid 1,2-hydratase